MTIELMTAAPDFSDPLGLLSACHGRIESQCATLLRLPGHLRLHGSDSQAKQAAAKALKYFNTAGKHHHEDEEMDLFPMLEEYAESDHRLLALLDELRIEHSQMEKAWQDLEYFLSKLASDHEVMPEALPITQFVALYRSHIAKEDRVLFPFACLKLTAVQLSVLGDNMAERRNVKKINI